MKNVIMKLLRKYMIKGHGSRLAARGDIQQKYHVDRI